MSYTSEIVWHDIDPLGLPEDASRQQVLIYTPDGGTRVEWSDFEGWTKDFPALARTDGALWARLPVPIAE